MGTMVMSTVSVIVSVIVVRIHTVSTTALPSCVRAIVLGCVGRLLCVTVPSRPKSTVVSHQDNHVTPAVRVDGDPASSTLAATSAKAVPNKLPRYSTNSTGDVTGTLHCNGCQLKPQVEQLLCELRKVFRFSIHTVQLQQNRQWIVSNWVKWVTFLDKSHGLTRDPLPFVGNVVCLGTLVHFG